jgi:predicted lipid-binding transport protein (Tim44 family)
LGAPGYGGLARPGFGGGGFMSGLLGGFIGAGLVGMLFGSGFSGGMGGLGSGGGIGSMLGLILQLGLIFLLVRWGMNWYRNRSPATAPRFGGSAYQSEQPTQAPHAASYGSAPYAPQQPLPMGRDIQISPADFDVFEARLAEIQAAWTMADLNALRRLVTPEMLQYFGEQLATDSSQGIQNKVEHVRLLKGDLAEAWEENGMTYASVAIQFEALDYDVALDGGEVVSGDPTSPVVATEIWTFLRARGGQWMLSAIQQT